VANTNNHRIAYFDKNGEFKYSFGAPGLEEDNSGIHDK